MGRADVPPRSAGAPWPLVERRAPRRPLDEGSPLLRLPRQPSGPPQAAPSPAPLGEHVRRVLPVAAASPARARVPVLLGDLIGVVLLVAAGTGSPVAVTVALSWCLALVLAEVTAPPGWTAGPRQVLLAGGGLVLAAALVAYAADLDVPRALVLGALPLAVGLSATGRAVRPARTAESSRVVLVGTPESVVAARALLVRAGSDVSVVGICCPVMAGAPASIGGVPSSATSTSWHRPSGAAASTSSWCAPPPRRPVRCCAASCGTSRARGCPCSSHRASWSWDRTACG